MRVRCLTLATGSKGNATYIGTEHAQVLIDCGIGPRRLAQTLKSHGIDFKQLDAVFVTHLHTDHVGGLPALLKHIPLRIYCHQRAAATLAAMLRGEPVSEDWARHVKKQPALFAEPVPAAAELVTFNGESGFHHRDLDVLALRVSHDCDPTVGFKVFAGGRRLGVLTDLGTYDEQHTAAFGDCDVLLLEANHCPLMLATGGYPEHLKARIRGPRGHLSNEQSVQFAAGLGSLPRHLILGHLSDNNNRPAAVHRAYGELFGAAAGADSPHYTVLTQLQPGPLVEL